MICTHDNCSTCPYPDCISDNGPTTNIKKKPGRPKIPIEIKLQHQRDYAKTYYQEHKAEHAAYYKEYNRINADKVRAKQKSYRDKQRGHASTHPTIWITNGCNNTRIPETDPIPEGWYRGRSI